MSIMTTNTAANIAVVTTIWCDQLLVYNIMAFFPAELRYVYPKAVVEEEKKLSMLQWCNR